MVPARTKLSQALPEPLQIKGRKSLARMDLRTRLVPMSEWASIAVFACTKRALSSFGPTPVGPKDLSVSFKQSVSFCEFFPLLQRPFFLRAIMMSVVPLEGCHDHRDPRHSFRRSDAHWKISRWSRRILRARAWCQGRRRSDSPR